MNIKHPHRHNEVTYAAAGSVTETSFQAMLGVWYQVADKLRAMPPGTLMRYPEGYLFMGELNGELFMFESMDVEPGMKSCNFNLFRPDDFNGIDEAEFDQIKSGLESLLAAGPEYAAIDPEVIANAIDITYLTVTPSVANWLWDGVGPA